MNLKKSDFNALEKNEGLMISVRSVDSALQFLRGESVTLTANISPQALSVQPHWALVYHEINRKN